MVTSQGEMEDGGGTRWKVPGSSSDRVKPGAVIEENRKAVRCLKPLRFEVVTVNQSHTQPQRRTQSGEVVPN